MSYCMLIEGDNGFSGSEEVILRILRALIISIHIKVYITSLFERMDENLV